MTDTTRFGTPLAPPASAIPVSALARLARQHLESAFPLCWVSGEISNLTYAASGHAYFSLKDASAQVRCVMFRSRAQLLGWRLENGQQVEARVLVTLYEARGDFQLNVEAVRKGGIGNLYERFLQLKDKLALEGLFAEDGKRTLPPYPRRIGIITSPKAAALRDVLSTLARRAPHLEVVLYPTAVQGEGAAAQIAAAVELANQRRECDVLLLCRGGGSIEDLWAFNDETLARTLRAGPLPIITGVGHETDFTIADFAADRRAPTPTGAAEIAAPERAQVFAQLAEIRRTLRQQSSRQIERYAQRLDSLSQRLQHPAQRLARQGEHLLNLQRRMNSALKSVCARGEHTLAQITRRLLLSRPDTGRYARRIEVLAPQLRHAWQQLVERRTAALGQLSASLGHLNPQAVLARGFSIVTDRDGNIVREAAALEPNDPIVVSFHAGRVDAKVITVNETSTP